MLFDRFGPAQAGNGQALPNQQATAGAPGLQLDSWGHQPNFAGGMQQFLRPGMGQPTGQPGQPGQPGTQVAVGAPQGIANATGMGGVVGSPAGTVGGGNMASGMQQYLGRPS